MKRKLLIVTLLVSLLALSAAAAAPADFTKFGAILSGAGEVPVRDTNARGVALFNLDESAGEITYMLIVANIENVFASHIHCGAAGVNGPVGVTLFLGTPGSGRFDGILARGTLTSPDPGNACGWADFGDVVDAIMAGGAYVNVHTNDGVAPTNTGPGDFPGGEIRGQVRLAGSN